MAASAALTKTAGFHPEYRLVDILSDRLVVRYDDSLQSIVIEHLNDEGRMGPLVRVRHETYSKMSFEECSEFLGARVLLLMPSMREHFKAELDKMASSP